MKVNLVIAALLGLVAFNQVEAMKMKEQNQLDVQDDDLDSDEDELLALDDEDDDKDDEEGGEDDDDDEDGDQQDAPQDNTNLQLSVTGDYFTADMSGHAGLGESPYQRVVPARFADGGDPFMASMILNYALEGKTDDGAPNGKFFMNTAQTQQAAKEVLKAHKKLTGKELEEYMKTYFTRTWAHFDINKDGILDVDTMP